VLPALSLFELQWLMSALGMAIPADRLLDVEKELDPKSTGQVSSRALLDWIAAHESGGFSSIVQAAANAVKAAVRVMTGTLYSEHARQVVLMAARKRARMVLQYEHQCFTDQKTSGKKVKASGKQDKKSSAFDANDSEVFFQGGSVLAQMAALRVAHDACEVSMVQQALLEDNERRHSRARWLRHDASHEAASQTVRAMDDVVQVFGGLTRVALSGAEASLPKRRETSTFHVPGQAPGTPSLREEGEWVGAVAESEPLVPIDNAPTTMPTPHEKESMVSAATAVGDTAAMDPFAILGVPDSSDVNTLLAKAQDTVAYFLVHLFDVTSAQSLSEVEVSALLLVLQRGVSNRELLHRFPRVRHDRTSLQHMARYLKERLYVIPEASVRNTSVLGRVFGLKDAFVARCGTSRAASKIAALGTAESVAQERSTADRYWEARGRYYRDRAESFFKPRSVDDKVAAQFDLSEQEKKPDNDLLLHHRAQLLAMQQVQMSLRSDEGKAVFAVEKDRVSGLWEDRCAEAFGYSRHGTETELVDALLGYAFDVFATDVLPVTDGSVERARGMLVTELPFLMHFCVARLRLASSPHLGRVFAMALLLVHRDDMSFLSRHHVFDLLRPAFHLRALPEGFFARLLDQLSQPSAVSMVDYDATAALMSRARQEAAFNCFQFQYNAQNS
jgi:hypothetical protein